MVLYEIIFHFYFIGQFILLSLFLRVCLRIEYSVQFLIDINNWDFVLAVQYAFDPNVFINLICLKYL
jgi:hypothetical protein